MKATIEFNLPEEDNDFRRYAAADDMASVLWDIDQWLRGKIKYPPEDIKDGAYEAYDETREELSRLMGEHDVNLDRIWT